MMVVKVKALMPDGEMMLVTRGMTTVEKRWLAPVWIHYARM